MNAPYYSDASVTTDPYCGVPYGYGADRFSSRDRRRTSRVFRPFDGWIPCIPSRPKLSLRCGRRIEWSADPDSGQVHAQATTDPSTRPAHPRLHVARTPCRQARCALLRRWRVRCASPGGVGYSDHRISATGRVEADHPHPGSGSSVKWGETRKTVCGLPVREGIEFGDCR